MTITTDAAGTAADEMAEPSLRERKKRATRRALHEAAFRLIDEQGLEQTTVEQICAAADVSPRTFFNYFPSKAAAALDLAEAAIDAEATTMFLAASGGLVDALCAVMAGAGESASSHARLKGLVSRRPELIPALTQGMGARRGAYIDLAEQRASSREEAELAVTLVMASLASLVHIGGAAGDVPTAASLRSRADRLAGIRSTPLR